MGFQAIFRDFHEFTLKKKKLLLKVIEIRIAILESATNNNISSLACFFMRFLIFGYYESWFVKKKNFTKCMKNWFIYIFVTFL